MYSVKTGVASAEKVLEAHGLTPLELKPKVEFQFLIILARLLYTKIFS
jgi:hypothetical protein